MTPFQHQREKRNRLASGNMTWESRMQVGVYMHSFSQIFLFPDSSTEPCALQTYNILSGQRIGGVFVEFLLNNSYSYNL